VTLGPHQHSERVSSKTRTTTSLSGSKSTRASSSPPPRNGYFASLASCTYSCAINSAPRTPPPSPICARTYSGTIDRHGFLLSTHYTHYEPVNFGIKFAALMFVLTPKLPQVRKTPPPRSCGLRIKNTSYGCSSMGSAYKSFYLPIYGTLTPKPS